MTHYLKTIPLMLALACSKSPTPVANEQPPPSEAPTHRATQAAPPTASDGKAVFQRRGCLQCHSVDGAASAGPGLKGRWGQPVQLHDGTSVTFDDAYARESVVEPLAKIPHGFVGNMPNYRGILREREVDALVAYMKTL